MKVIWKDGSAVKSNCWSCRGPGFPSLYTHGSSQPSLLPVPYGLMPFSDIHRHCTSMVHTHICRQNMQTHTKIIKKLKKIKLKTNSMEQSESWAISVDFFVTKYITVDFFHLSTNSMETEYNQQIKPNFAHIIKCTKVYRTIKNLEVFLKYIISRTFLMDILISKSGNGTKESSFCKKCLQIISLEKAHGFSFRREGFSIFYHQRNSTGFWGILCWNPLNHSGIQPHSITKPSQGSFQAPSDHVFVITVR